MAKLSEKKMQEIRDRTISKVLWGEHEALTLEFLRKEGLGGPEIGEILDEAHAEKARLQRRGLFGKLAIYLFGALAFAAMVLFLKSRPELLQTLSGRVSFIGAILACSGCVSVLFLTVIDEYRKNGKKKSVKK